MPESSGNVKVKWINQRGFQDFSYNARHKWITGLAGWYRTNYVEIGSVIQIAASKKGITLSLSETLAPNLSGLSSVMKGNIVEDKVKEMLLLYGQGLLSVFKPVVDNIGIDLIVMKAGVFNPIFLQIKSRFNAGNSGQVIFDISTKTFIPDKRFFLLGVSFNPQSLELDSQVLLIPSKLLQRKGLLVTNKKRAIHRVNSSLRKGAKGKWANYFVNKCDLVGKLITEIETDSAIPKNKKRQTGK